MKTKKERKQGRKKEKNKKRQRESRGGVKNKREKQRETLKNKQMPFLRWKPAFSLRKTAQKQKQKQKENKKHTKTNKKGLGPSDLALRATSADP